MPTETKPTSSWRDTLPVHPAAELFPLPSPDELRALGADILKNGLTSPIVLWQDKPASSPVLLDGRSRCSGLELATGKPVRIARLKREWTISVGDWSSKQVIVTATADPWGYVASVNLYRRHLTIEQKRTLITKLLKADPSRSDRSVAEVVKVSPTFVGKVRAEKEASGDVCAVDTRTDSKGRTQPAHRVASPDVALTRARSAAKREAQAAHDKQRYDEAMQGKHRQAEPESDVCAVDTSDRNDIGPASHSEVERLRARVEELQAEVHQRDIRIVGLVSEIEELRARVADDGIPQSLRRVAS